MLVSTKGRYALRVMLELAQDDGAAYLPLPAIAERQGISEKYLESIISVLSKSGRFLFFRSDSALVLRLGRIRLAGSVGLSGPPGYRQPRPHRGSW